jgi:hypothetical protein
LPSTASSSDSGANRELLAGEATELAQRRVAFAAELHDVLRRLEILAGWERPHRGRREGEIDRDRPRRAKPGR